MFGTTARTIDRVGAAVLLAAAAWSAFAAVRLCARKARDVAAETEIVDQCQQQGARAQTILLQARRALAVTEKEWKHAEGNASDTAKIGSFMERIDALAKARRVSVTGLQPQAAVKTAVYTRLPVRVSVVGAFPDIHHLLYDVERMSALTQVESVRITREPESSACAADLTVGLFEF